VAVKIIYFRRQLISLHCVPAVQLDSISVGITLGRIGGVAVKIHLFQTSLGSFIFCVRGTIGWEANGAP
jgi:hypothetical protein